MSIIKGLSFERNRQTNRDQNRRIRQKIRQFDKEHLSSEQLRRVKNLHKNLKHQVQADQPRRC